MAEFSRFKKHQFDEKMKFSYILLMVSLSIILVIFKSDLARDVILLIIGVIGGRYIKA
jgi:hypothetical protein